MVKLQGIYASLVTPFDKNKKVDERQLRRLIDEMIHSGAAGIYILGKNSEAHYLTATEKMLIADVAANVVNKRVDLIAESTASSDRELLEQNRVLIDSGIDCLSIDIDPSESNDASHIIQRCQTIAENSAVPLMIKPGQNHQTLNEHTVAVRELSFHDNILALNASSSTLSSFIRFNKFRSEKFFTFTSNDLLVYWALLGGGSGAVSTVINALPKLVIEIYSKLNSGDCEAALRAQRKVIKIAEAIDFHDVPYALKEVTSLMNMPVGPPRHTGDISSILKNKDIFDLTAEYFADFK